jgi:4-hydroxybenzoate polyprenyltransferase
MTPLAFTLHPFFLLALAIAYWAIFQPDSPRLKRNVLVSVCLLVIVAGTSVVLKAAEIREPCINVDPNSWWWWFFGCGL